MDHDIWIGFGPGEPWAKLKKILVFKFYIRIFILFLVEFSRLKVQNFPAPNPNHTTFFAKFYIYLFFLQIRF